MNIVEVFFALAWIVLLVIIVVEIRRDKELDPGMFLTWIVLTGGWFVYLFTSHPDMLTKPLW